MVSAWYHNDAKRLELADLNYIFEAPIVVFATKQSRTGRRGGGKQMRSRKNDLIDVFIVVILVRESQIWPTNPNFSQRHCAL